MNSYLSILAVSESGGFFRVESTEDPSCLVVIRCVSLSLSLSCRCRCYMGMGLWWCGAWLTRWKKTVCTFKTSPCVRTTRPHLWTRCECVVSTHGDVLNVHTGGGSLSVRLTKIYPRKVFTCPRSSTEKSMHVAESSICSLQLNTLFNSRHMTQRDTTAQHNTAQNTRQHRRKEKWRTDERDEERDEKRYKWEERRVKERRESLMVKPERFESWSSTTLTRILRVTLSMSRAITQDHGKYLFM